MPITSLRITNFRNLKAVELIPCSTGLNIICGNNGSGKTSLLEAIYYLGHGRSFRTSTSNRLISHSDEKFSIFSQLLTDGLRDFPVGVERDLNGSSRLRIAETDTASLSELASFMPIRIINSQSHQIFESGPAYRRKFLDWGLFYHSEGFLPCWRQFERVLKQRNVILRENRPKRELDVWTEELIKYGLEFNKFRNDYVRALAPIVNEIARELLSIQHIDFNYRCGWDESEDYAAILMESFREEYGAGCTQYGPHRADLDISIDDILVKHFLSRGQQKLLICAMILAQGILLSKQANKGLIYLVDDLPSELDFQSKNKLISLLSRQQTQIFITAIESQDICEFITDKHNVSMRVFHVEHGNVV